MNSMKTALLSAIIPVFLLSAERVSACYDPGTQRWLTRDPIGEVGGLNPYRYVGNNPTSNLDPYGLCEPGKHTLGSLVGLLMLIFQPELLMGRAAVVTEARLAVSTGETLAKAGSVQAAAGRTILNPVGKPASLLEYWKPRYNPQALVFDGQASTAIHEGQHLADILAHPQLTSLTDHVFFPGAGFARYGFEYRAYAAEGALSTPLTPFRSFDLSHLVNFGADVGVFVGLPAAAGCSLSQGTH